MENKEYSHCLRCGRKLKNEKAKKIGYGVVCWKKAQCERKKFKKLFPIPIDKHINI